MFTSAVPACGDLGQAGVVRGREPRGSARAQSRREGYGDAARALRSRPPLISPRPRPRAPLAPAADQGRQLRQNRPAAVFRLRPRRRGYGLPTVRARASIIQPRRRRRRRRVVSADGPFFAFQLVGAGLRLTVRVHRFINADHNENMPLN